MHVAASNWPVRQCHRESNGLQSVTCRDLLRDARVAAVAVQFAAPSCCSLDWRAACHGAQHLPCPLGDTRGRKRERDPTGDLAGWPHESEQHLPQGSQTSALLALRRLAGYRLKFCPQGQLTTDGTPLKTQMPLTRHETLARTRGRRSAARGSFPAGQIVVNRLTIPPAIPRAGRRPEYPGRIGPERQPVARLENRCAASPYRGFESLPLR